MSHFYGNITNSARKTNATARAHKNNGLTVEAQSWEGKIVVELTYSEENKKDYFRVYRKPHKSSRNQETYIISEGLVDGTFFLPDLSGVISEAV